jgi:PRTRC genetic system protein F
MMGALALPALSPAIPRHLYIPGETGLTAPLALALLEANIVTDAMLLPGRNRTLVEVFNEPNEREMAIHALSTWWTALQKRFRTTHFKWDLHVQDLNDIEDHTGGRRSTELTGWFCMTRNQNSDIPRVSLARRAEILEKCLEGFGQTALAVLHDATRYLPEAFTPWFAEGIAESMYWQDSENDEEMIAQAIEEGRIEATMTGLAPDAFTGDLMTRAHFYEDMPRWVTNPRRVASREAIVRAARGKPYEKSVIAACDKIIEVVSRPGFDLHSWDCGVQAYGHYNIDAFACVLWREGDTLTTTIDNWLNDIGQCGEYVDFISMNQVPLNASKLLEYMRGIECMMELAQATEALLFLLGDEI